MRSIPPPPPPPRLKEELELELSKAGVGDVTSRAFISEPFYWLSPASQRRVAPPIGTLLISVVVVVRVAFVPLTLSHLRSILTVYYKEHPQGLSLTGPCTLSLPLYSLTLHALAPILLSKKKETKGKIAG